MSTKERNIQIWLDTVKRCHQIHYPSSQSILYNQLPLNPVPRYSSTLVSVVNTDTLSCCDSLVRQGHNVLGLNMANPNHPGGGVTHGCFCQEENCFRRSNYFISLRPELYPIPETGCLYTPTITVIKDANYNLLAQPFTLSMVACAALRLPSLTEDGQYKYINDHNMMKHKISQIFQVGCQEQKDTLVLGAFGAGAFENPPRVVAELFNEVIDQYQHCFRMIIFAVLSQHDNNYEIFSRIIHQGQH